MVSLSGSGSWASPGAGITHGYNDDSPSLRTFVTFCCGLALYNACELLLMVFLTFKRFSGAYFWSMLVAGMGIIPYAIGFLLKFLITTTGKVTWIPAVILTIGWYAMVTGQSFVLWSRLHLIVAGSRGDKIIRYSKWMIITNIFILHLPTTVLTFGSTGTIDPNAFQNAYNVMEKIQMTGFFLQETILSTIYIVETARILRLSLQPATRKVMKQLVFINIVIISMDLGLIGLEYASLYILETLVKGVVYSVKLKLEFVILGKLVKLVGGSRPGSDPRKESVGFIATHHNGSRVDAEMNVRDFVKLEKTTTALSHPSRAHHFPDSLPSTRRRSSRVAGMDFDFDMARFEHAEDVSSLHGTRSGTSSPDSDHKKSSPSHASSHSVEGDPSSRQSGVP